MKIPDKKSINNKKNNSIQNSFSILASEKPHTRFSFRSIKQTVGTNVYNLISPKKFPFSLAKK